MSRKQFLASVYSRLMMHNALGIDSYPANSDLQRFFALTEKKTGSSQLIEKSIDNDRSPEKKKKNRVENRERLQLLRQEIHQCSRCFLYKEKLGCVPGGGNSSSGLVIVGEWSEQTRDIFQEKIYFGPNEDDMLWKMMAAIGLKPEEIYVTNCLKCCPGGKSMPDDQCSKSCFSYLEREIALIAPKVICAMGEVAAALLTGSAAPLARIRGKFVQYRYSKGQEILVMPTYHPRFLLKHQEMKKATWLDLQAIQKKLAEK